MFSAKPKEIRQNGEDDAEASSSSHVDPMVRRAIVDYGALLLTSSPSRLRTGGLGDRIIDLFCA